MMQDTVGAADESVMESGRPLSRAVAPAASCACGGSCGGTCPSCATAAADSATVFVYAIGNIRPNIPNLGLEKEIAQTVGKVFTSGPSDEEALCELLADPAHRRLASEICWSLSIADSDVYVLRPAGDFGLSLLLKALRTDKSAFDVDVVIGRMVGTSGLTECNGKILPALAPSQIYSMDRATLLESLGRSEEVPEDALKSAVKQTLDVTGQLAGNYGISAPHRALNYAVTRSAELYQSVATQLLDNYTLAGLSTRPSAVSAGRSVVDVILIFRGRVNDAVRKLYMKVDVTDLYPFMVSPIQPYLEFS